MKTQFRGDWILYPLLAFLSIHRNPAAKQFSSRPAEGSSSPARDRAAASNDTPKSPVAYRIPLNQAACTNWGPQFTETVRMAQYGPYMALSPLQKGPQFTETVVISCSSILVPFGLSAKELWSTTRTYEAGGTPGRAACPPPPEKSVFSKTKFKQRERCFKI